MKYERITYKDRDLPKTGVDGKRINAYCDLPRQEIINRLSELEDKIENGTLLDIPCKPGDTVYVLRDNEIVPMQLVYFYVSKKNIDRFYLVSGDDHYNFKPKHIGKTIFFTPEQAEDARKALQEGTI